LHVVTDVSEEDALMQEEIFGPILPIVTVESVREGTEFINSKPKPLSLYIFTQNKDRMNEIIEVTRLWLSGLLK
jgi:aldehyde dehydrogenase (NAD+)